MRVNGNGVTALPGLQTPPIDVPPSAPPAFELISQASGDTEAGIQGDLETDGDITLLPAATEDLEIRYQGSLPLFSTSEYISIRNKATGEEVERIFLNSDRVTFSSDRRTVTINPETTTTPGEVVCALLPDWPGVLPARTTPCCFSVAAAVIPPAATVPPVTNPFPWWVIPVGLGLGVGICAIAGCFDGGGGGGGGSNNVSR
uniref:hypothetical protein n=1 Tax=Synechococcus sp. CS-1329 TaxID=2847975 RepID=UPI00223A9D84|nr:hypothetical protein [Synechococcus sp. CS-1329]